MPITSIENGPGAMAPSQLPHSAGISMGTGMVLNPKSNAFDPPAATDTASVLSEVATSDLIKLANILDPAPDQNNSQILDSLLSRAVEEVAQGNAARAVGYLADYATRDPRRAETLPLQAELQPVRDKIDSMVSRMAEVARMSAENGLSRAEALSANAGNLPDWETHADVLLKVAHRIFESGGYANYSRTSNLARALTDAVSESIPAPQALAASASASAGIQTNQMLPGSDVPYWASPEPPVSLPFENTRGAILPYGEFPRLGRPKKIHFLPPRSLWNRSPLLVLWLVWLFVGLFGGLVFLLAGRFGPDNLLARMGNFGFELFGLGFLAVAVFGLCVRARPR